MVVETNGMTGRPGRGVAGDCRRRSYLDAVLVASLIVVQIVTTGLIVFVGNRDRHHELAAFGGTALLLLGYLALLWRRRSPVLVLCVTLFVYAVAELIRGSGVLIFDPPLAALIAFYSVALVNPPSKTVKVASVAWLWMVGAGLMSAPLTWSNLLASLPFSTLIVGVGTSVGLYNSTRRKYIDQLREKAETLDREKDLLAARAVAEERVRIARDLHDVVSHHIALMVVQAGAAQATFSSDPKKSSEMIDQVANSGRSALSEMRRMLGVLRTPSSVDDSHEPTPGISDLKELIARTEEAGICVDFTIDGDPSVLSEQIQLTCFRIVQEALTNVIKYAPSSLASVSVKIETSRVVVCIVDNGPGIEAQTGPGAGHGIPGMMERVALFGGVVRTGHRSEGGFEVVAMLPHLSGVVT